VLPGREDEMSVLREAVESPTVIELSDELGGMLVTELGLGVGNLQAVGVIFFWCKTPTHRHMAFSPFQFMKLTQVLDEVSISGESLVNLP